MDFRDSLKLDCTLDHGRISESGCLACPYYCYFGYKKSPISSTVHCDTSSGKWVTSLFGTKPCVREDVYTTRKMFDFGDFGDLPTTRKMVDFGDLPSIKTPKYTFAPYDFHYNEDTEDNVHVTEMNPGAVFGIIIASIVVFMILLICLRVCIARCAAQRRQQRLNRLALVVDHLNAQIQQSREARNTQRVAQNFQSSSTGNAPPRPNGTPASVRNDRGNESQEEGIIIVRIRRFFCIPVLRNPYRAFRNPPEPPPYDAESAAPPAYEETDGANRFTAETDHQLTGNESSDTPTDPPPPYSARVV